MAKPRIFISSTYYDLKHLRSSLENFIDTLGFDPVLSEKGDIAYSPDVPLDESCYREVKNADIYVLIIGGRYGSEASGSKSKLPRDFHTRYESITKLEYKNASDNNVPIYILIEKSVYADYENYLKNKANTTFNYAHVDSINIFIFIEEIISQTRNNPIFQFDKYSDIEGWLREQWAGLFRELLKKISSQSQLSSLANQINELSEINKTLKKYLETVMNKIVPVDSEKIIKEESARLKEAMKLSRINESKLVNYLQARYGIKLLDIYKALLTETNAESFLRNLEKINPTEEFKNEVNRILANHKDEITSDFFHAKNLLDNGVENITETNTMKKRNPSKTTSKEKV
jgi:hypothetical protein